ncbi:hypothetical protein [Paracoccus homiensis]|uniref:Uncharacterized protein n=1 Tax=Paracoccus homiensis TaxID=364199 RepID=A0A1I0GX16_9RHOB|nr:hypothetical protein [Paracoccus homiensis]SET75732.1 hypothetical protein SAMN04489858_109126 [Paracoccus homiensis]
MSDEQVDAIGIEQIGEDELAAFLASQAPHANRVHTFWTRNIVRVGFAEQLLPDQPLAPRGAITMDVYTASQLVELLQAALKDANTSG